jgi:hypothetical protein
MPTADSPMSYYLSSKFYLCALQLLLREVQTLSRLSEHHCGAHASIRCVNIDGVKKSIDYG